MLKNRKIVSNVALGFAIVFLLAAIASVVALLNIGTIANNTQLFYQQPYLQNDNVSQVLLNLSNEKLRVYQSISEKSADSEKADAVSGATQSLDYSMTELKKSFADANDTTFLSQLEDAQQAIATAHASMDKIHEAADSGSTQQALQLYNSDFLPNFLIAENAMQAVHEKAGEKAKLFAADAASLNKRTMLLIVIVMGAGFLISLGVSAAVYKSIRIPMAQILPAMRKLAGGDLDIAIAYTSKNEFGELSAEITLIAEKLRKLVAEAEHLTDEAASGNFDTRSQADEHGGGYKKILDGVNRTLDTVVDKMHWYESLLDSIPNPITAIDLDFNYTFANLAAAKSIGVAKTEALGKPCSEYGISACGSDEFTVGELRENESTSMDFLRDDREYNIQASRLFNRAGQTTGFVELIRETTQERRQASYQKTEVERLSENLELLSQGSLHLNLSVTQADAFTQTEFAYFNKINESFKQARNNLADYIGEINTVLHQVSVGNLDVAAVGDFKGDLAQIKTSLNQIVDSLNSVLSQISVSSHQVFSGAGQVASGAQSLSRGSTEQASAIEELSATIENIAAQSDENAQRAHLMQTISVSAADAIHHEHENIRKMVEAMARIDQASQQISKIIKTIDEIAFQTNILALNAAVEAARAGEAGKGFAVVADEVRNLASKSADAAKDTATLIENTINAVQQGAQLADATAKSLGAMVDSAQNNAQTAQEIAQTSSHQATEIKQVTQAIKQISDVVQQNSATAEQSAAASEELSAQADHLNQLIGSFTLKG